MVHDRKSSGDELAGILKQVDADTVVAGIPRGGAIVAARVALKLGLEYECVPVCRIGMPCFPDLTLGALDPDGIATFDPRSELTRHELNKAGGALATRLQQQVDRCRGDRRPIDFEGREVLVVDEWADNEMVPGSAVSYLKRHGARRITLAVPVMAQELAESMDETFNEVVALQRVPLADIAGWYGAAEPTDEEIHDCLVSAWSVKAG